MARLCSSLPQLALHFAVWLLQHFRRGARLREPALAVARTVSPVQADLVVLCLCSPAQRGQQASRRLRSFLATIVCQARDSIIAQVMEQLSSLLTQSIEMHWQRQALLLRQRELEQEGLCCTTEESAESELQDQRQKDAAFEEAAQSAFPPRPTTTAEAKEEALLFPSSVADTNGSELLESSPRRSAPVAAPGSAVGGEPEPEEEPGLRRNWEPEGGAAGVLGMQGEAARKSPRAFYKAIVLAPVD